MEHERLSTLTQVQRDTHATLDLLRYLSCATDARSEGTAAPALQLFLDRYPAALHAPVMRKQLETYYSKAAVGAGSSTDATWAAPLVTRPLTDPILSLVQSQSLLGRVVGFQRAPFLADVPLQTATGTYAWVAENSPKPVTTLPFGTVQLQKGKIGGVVVLSKELVKLAPGAEGIMREALTGGIVNFQDAQMLDPTVTLIANARPASLTAGVTPTTATADLDASVAAVLAALYASRPGAERPSLIMSPATAGKLASSGKHAGLTVTGGTAHGVPVYPTPAAGARVVAVDATAVLFADAGIEIDVSLQAGVEMNDAPGAPAASTVLISFWQMNLAGFRIERFLWWVAASGAVQHFVVV